MITWTQQGQPRPYADSIFAGTVTAESEADARVLIVKARYNNPIYNIGEPCEWWQSRFTKFKMVESGKWEFSVTQPYTD